MLAAILYDDFNV